MIMARIAGLAHPVFQSDLKDHTRKLLIAKVRLPTHSYVSVARETGLSATWVGMFARNELKQADVGRVETLYKYLANKELNF